MAAALGIGLAALSAAASSTAHATIKSGADKFGVLVWAGLVEAALALPFLLWLGLPERQLWIWLLVGMALHAAYYGALIWSYSVSDYSSAYPIARGVIPIITSIFGVVWLGDHLSLAAFTSILAICAGVLLLSSTGGLSRKAIGIAALCGVINAAFTLVDSQAMRLAAQPAQFLASYYVLDGLTMPLVSLAARHRTTPLFAQRATRRAGAFTGIMGVLAFMPALIAARFIPVGAVSAIRATSVLMSLFIGGRLLQETMGARKVVGSCAIVAGAIALIVTTTKA